MKSFCKILYFCLFGFIIGCFIGCSRAKKIHPSEIHYIKPPKWVREAGNSDGFSAIGITEKDVNLKKAKELAKRNAVENLKINIMVKMENFLINETASIDLVRRNILLSTLSKTIEKDLTNDYLTSISRIDEFWKSPDSDALYLKIVAEQKIVATKIVESIDKIKVNYKQDNEIMFLLSKIKNDIVLNNFKKSNLIFPFMKNKEGEDITQGKKNKKNNNSEKDKNLVISNIIVTHKEDKNSGESNYDLNGDGIIDDDEIDQAIREAIKKSEEAEEREEKKKK